MFFVYHLLHVGYMYICGMTTHIIMRECGSQALVQNVQTRFKMSLRSRNFLLLEGVITQVTWK